MRRSLHYFWPRAESNLYAEPKRLVEAGLAEAREEWNGDRRRSVYTITDEGRDALREWLATPSAGQRLESEPHVRLLFANYGAMGSYGGRSMGVDDGARRRLGIGDVVACRRSARPRLTRPDPLAEIRLQSRS